jgi:F420-non-reducing hydrogenase iron-sulfur subunit
MEEFEPKIIGFFCNWCSYTAANLAGTSRMKMPPNVKIVRVPCSGRVDEKLISKAFSAGADGVLVCGCHPGDCHYKTGNLNARRRVTGLKPFFESIGIGSDRLRLEWISASEGGKVADTISSFTQTIKGLGPSPLNRRHNGH